VLNIDFSHLSGFKSTTPKIPKVTSAIKIFPIAGNFESHHTMPIWKRPATPAAIEARLANSLPGAFGIRILEVGTDFIRAEMPVDRRHVQPYGILHGGASVVLAETLGSIATTLTLPEGQQAVGLEVNANHVSAVPEGETVTALCRPLHLGRRTQVWQTEIHRPNGKLACVSRLTTAVLDRKAD
jgi:1,4-dihydroxy-2-naphthoyl-CoA hydrolase